MTITFNVCQIKEEDVDMKRIKTFDINDFVTKEIICSTKKERYGYLNDTYNDYYWELDQEGYYESNGTFVKFDKEVLKKNQLEKEKRIKLKKENDELIESKIKKFKILKSSFNETNKYVISKYNMVVNNYNSFVISAWLAYNNHHHLEIRPDNVWLAIMVQFSFYVNGNSEFLKERFVDFHGKQILEVQTDYPILEAPFDKLTIDMSKQIQKNIKDPSIKDWIVPNFSTTTENDKVVFSVSLMSTLKKFFDYSMSSACGLPKVTLLGTVSDWIDLKERVQRLTEFDNNEHHMNKWVNYLLPIMDNFIQSANGNPDVIWWNKIVDENQQSGSNIISGWLSVFCIFDDQGKYDDDAKSFITSESESIWPKVFDTRIGSGYSSVPVLLKDFDGSIYESQIYAGHFTSKIEKSKLTPSLDWFIVANHSTAPSNESHLNT